MESNADDNRTPTSWLRKSPDEKRTFAGYSLNTVAVILVILFISLWSILQEGRQTLEIQYHVAREVFGNNAPSVNHHAGNDSDTGNSTRFPTLNFDHSNRNQFETPLGNSSKSVTFEVQNSVEPRPGVFDIGYDYVFWEGKGKICKLLKNITHVSVLGQDTPSYILAKESPPIVNLTWPCEEMMSNTGNWITGFYHLRLACALAQVDFHFQCSSGMKLASQSVLPWLTGVYSVPERDESNTWPYDFGWPDPDNVCAKTYKKLPIHHLTRVIQRDMREIAVSILGSRNESGREIKVTFRALPELPSIEPFRSWKEADVDDAAIHFRCGDVFGGTGKDVYGFIKFKEFVDRMPKETTRTIGIHTQPFETKRLREADKDAARDCKKVVHLLVDTLQREFPNTTVSIRNTQEDTIPLTYARLTMAFQSITTMSTFGIFPAIGCFGDGYFQVSGRQNKFAHYVPELLPNFHNMTGPILSSPSIRKTNWEGVANFLTSPD